jgi:hypothetical protein
VHTEKVGAVALLDDGAEFLFLRRVDIIKVTEILACLPQDVDGFDVGQSHVALRPLLEFKRSDFVPDSYCLEKQCDCMSEQCDCMSEQCDCMSEQCDCMSEQCDCMSEQCDLLLRSDIDFMSVLRLQAVEDVRENDFQHVQGLEVVLLDFHLNVEPSELGEVSG